ncbi:MAG: pyruvate dehydrogenase complex E1 component subunit beta [Candidatus Omnitrophica bacterium]|nr:pyruvate dehydrogenase complex E1 component subunit beta [Candidatus Omnitrophota bacterium]
MDREITYAQAILEATDQCMQNDPSVYIMGLGVPDPKGIFGTTLGLAAKFGNKRVMDMPVSENAMTGVAIGSSLAGMRPIITHQRIDFMLLSLDQIINNAAKWHYMFGAKMTVPLVLRLLVGRGWGQGPQHSQSLQALFAHIPGLKVVMPFSPSDAKGMLISAIEDDNPVIFIEHRWLHGITGNVPKQIYRVPIGKAKIIRQGTDITIIASSYMTLEAIRSAQILGRHGISAEVIDLRTIKPLDEKTIINSVNKTRRMIVVDGACKSFGVSAEIAALVGEKCFNRLKSPCRRVAFPDSPTPTSWSLANHYYPTALDILAAARNIFKVKQVWEEEKNRCLSVPYDVPDKSFTGPF